MQKDLFRGKVVLISGGATGICYGISELFLRHGATVVIVSRKIDVISKARVQLAEATGNSSVFGYSCDVRDEKVIEATVKKVVEQHGNISVLVNGAAGNFLCPFEKLTGNGFRTVLMIDTVGTFLLSKFACEHGLRAGGVIVNISANLHLSGTALQAHAGTAKAGVDALTKHMAVELGPKAIRVVGICPGVIDGTVGFEKLSQGLGDKSSISRTVPLQRLGTPKDIAQAALFLASDAASYITGVTLPVDGGHTLTAPNFPFHSQDFLEYYAPKPKI